MPPKRKLRACDQGSSCKYLHEHQHISEFSHGEESDALADRAKKRKETAWKLTEGQRLGVGVPRDTQRRDTQRTTNTSSSRGSLLEKPKSSAEAARAAAISRLGGKSVSHANDLDEASAEDSRCQKRPLHESNSSFSSGDGSRATGDGTPSWCCPACTFSNHGILPACEVCGSQRKTKPGRKK